MSKLIAFLKKHKEFIIFIVKTFRGSARLRAFKWYIAYLVALASGWGGYFVCDSTGIWSLEISYAALGLWEFAFAVIGFIGFYSWLYYDNKAEFNKSLGDLINKLDNIQDEVVQIRKGQEVAAILPFYTFSQFERLYNKHDVADFEDTDSLREKRELIVNPDEKYIRVLALSGTGKTFLILKAFKDCGTVDNVFYCESVSDSRFKDALKYLAENKPGCTIILDNCPSKVSDSVIENYGDKLRVVSAFYDPNNIDRYSKPIKLFDCGIPSVIKRIIQNNTIGNIPAAQIEFIEYHSGGIPLMALLLTQAYNKGGVYSDIHDDHLMENLLDIDLADKVNQRIAMRTLALFQPIDYDNAKSPSAEYIIKSDYFTPIVSQINRQLLFNKVVDKLNKRSLIEKDSIYINMRPQPLACWLVGEWLHEQGTFITDLINEITQYPKTFYDPIVESWAKRLEFMQGNHDAEDLYAELVRVHGGPFCNEDVICSDFGSRLILAMSTVNPVAVVECLYSVLFNKPVGYLKENLVDDARRNVVRTLEKLCFCEESFEKAACLLAKLALAENEGWANNARGQFLQLFHIALAGTVCDLNARVRVIQKLHDEDPAFSPLLLDAIKGAFNHTHLYRTGGAEKFGFIEKQDFHPDWIQISEYWNSLYNIIAVWVERDSSLVDNIAEIVCVNTRMFIRSRKPELLFQFIGLLAPRLNYNWNAMHKALVETKNYDAVRPEIGELIISWIDKLTPQDIIGRMKDALHDMYTKVHLDSNILDQEESIVKPFVVEFVEKKAYLTEEIFQLLDNNSGYTSWAFDTNLAKLIPAKDMPAFCAFLKDYIHRQDKSFYSSFLTSLFGRLENKKAVWPFARDLFEEGYYELTIPILAATDDIDRSQLAFVMKMANEGVISFAEVRRYLSAVRLNNSSEILDVAIKLKDNGADAPLLFDHISHYWYLDECLTNPELVRFYQDVIIDYPLKDNDSFNYEYTRLVKHLLEKTYDEEFAKSLNIKLIDYLSYNQSLFHVEEIYEVLLTDRYRSVIWDEFSKALTDFDNRAGFILNVRYTIGSGFEFGEKVLFAGHEEQMKQLCQDFKHGAFVCAATCPVFDKADELTGEVHSFHPFVIWLIQNYGEQQYVLDEFHSNLHTFHWTGSSIPLIEDRRRCFESLRDTTGLPSNVYHWIDLCLKDNVADYNREEKSEAFMRLAYGRNM